MQLRHDKDAMPASNPYAGTIGSDNSTGHGSSCRFLDRRDADLDQGGTMIKGGTRPALDGKNTLTQDGGRLTEI